MCGVRIENGKKASRLGPLEYLHVQALHNVRVQMGHSQDPSFNHRADGRIVVVLAHLLRSGAFASEAVRFKFGRFAGSSEE